MRIGIDCDGVLADFTTAFCALVKEQTGVVVPNPATSWDWYQNYITKEQSATAWNTITSSESFWTMIPRYPWTWSMISLLEDMIRGGDEVFYITHRAGKLAKRQTERWLTTRVFAECPTVIIDPEKSALASVLQLDVFVDDKAETCFSVKAKCPDALVVLFKQPHNESFHDAANGNGIAVMDWPTLKLTLETIKQARRG